MGRREDEGRRGRERGKGEGMEWEEEEKEGGGGRRREEGRGEGKVGMGEGGQERIRKGRLGGKKRYNEVVNDLTVSKCVNLPVAFSVFTT